MNKTLTIALGAFLIITAGWVQAAERVHRVGILFIGGKEQPHLPSFKQGLRELGYLEGKDIVLVYRYAEGSQEKLSDLAAELVRDQVDIIVTTAAVSARAARRITRTVPIVMTTGNPLESGLAESLAKPGGNVTGLTVMASDMSVKRLELLKESFPKRNRVAALWSPIEPEVVLGIKETTEAAKALSLHLHALELKSANDIERAFEALIKARDNALVVILSPLVTLNSKRIVDLALKNRIPGIYPTRQFAEEGGLMAYGPLIADLYRRAAAYVDKIIKGRSPGELPIEQPMKFDFIVNLRSAKRLGVTVPPNVVVRADSVIR